jgi:S1-C subfamily serine protease
MKKVFQANLILIDADRDLALIAPIAHQGVFEYFRIGKKPKIGQQVISLGSPLGIPRVASVGYIEAYLEDNYVYILHSAFINPGNSGGPLVSLDGKLIGINEATLNIDVIHAAQGMFIAISLYTIYDFLRRIQ